MLLITETKKIKAIQRIAEQFPYATWEVEEVYNHVNSFEMTQKICELSASLCLLSPLLIFRASHVD